ncbi:hypothetical protein LEMLEM_LOCUS1101, partial [Lemmus lemmus]
LDLPPVLRVPALLGRQLPHWGQGILFSTNSLLSLGSLLSRLALLPFLTQEAGHPRVTQSTSGPCFPWGTLISFDAWQVLGSWKTCCSLWACYPLGSSSTLAPHIPFLTSLALWPPWTFLTQCPSSSNGAHHAFMSTRTHLSLRSCHAWVAPDALETR